LPPGLLRVSVGTRGAAVAAALSFLGFIHAGAIGWAAAPRIALGYALLAATFAAFGWGRRQAADA